MKREAVQNERITSSSSSSSTAVARELARNSTSSSAPPHTQLPLQPSSQIVTSGRILFIALLIPLTSYSDIDRRLFDSQFALVLGCHSIPWNAYDCHC
ncbi:hypothetical protein RI129_000092 [Pyrocoelia pectoralis]|uniref:Uncharacterized protein n=1 Tax=Pyrocoelia pectoralis TaxID=417401 RepID=A0AAN7V0T6_9COLE